MYPHHLQFSPYFYLRVMFRKVCTELQRPFAGVMQNLVTSGSHKPPSEFDLTVRQEEIEFCHPLAQSCHAQITYTSRFFLRASSRSFWDLYLSERLIILWPMTSRCQIRDLSGRSLGSGGQRIHTPLQNKGFCLAAGATSNRLPLFCWILS
ncbi:hypothetical protein BDN67DRAFT_242052 [Paxillus ammoniavirescens]|nr:hypothetical protein BDN67DRAFT_242052 [Paxillus ammoniavirescens]